MSRRIDFLPQAIDDIDEAAFAIGLDSPQSALRFQVMAKASCLELGEMPRKGRRVMKAGRRELRRWRVEGFEHWLILYGVFADRVEIVRVLHGARDLDAALGGA